MKMLCLAMTARMSRRGFAFFLDLDMADASSLQAGVCWAETKQS
jgi:hypothetical protein